jgi:hypothetical protein
VRSPNCSPSAEGNRPAAGAAPTFRASTADGWHPSVCTEDGARFRIVTSAADFSHPIPAGFQSFAAAVGLADKPCAP